MGKSSQAGPWFKLKNFIWNWFWRILWASTFFWRLYSTCDWKKMWRGGLVNGVGWRLSFHVTTELSSWGGRTEKEMWAPVSGDWKRKFCGRVEILAGAWRGAGEGVEICEQLTNLLSAKSVSTNRSEAFGEETVKTLQISGIRNYWRNVIENLKKMWSNQQIANQCDWFAAIMGYFLRRFAERSRTWTPSLASCCVTLKKMWRSVEVDHWLSEDLPEISNPAPNPWMN